VTVNVTGTAARPQVSRKKRSKKGFSHLIGSSAKYKHSRSQISAYRPSYPTRSSDKLMNMNCSRVGENRNCPTTAGYENSFLLPNV